MNHGTSVSSLVRTWRAWAHHWHSSCVCTSPGTFLHLSGMQMTQAYLLPGLDGKVMMSIMVMKQDDVRFVFYECRGQMFGFLLTAPLKPWPKVNQRRVYRARSSNKWLQKLYCWITPSVRSDSHLLFSVCVCVRCHDVLATNLLSVAPRLNSQKSINYFLFQLISRTFVLCIKSWRCDPDGWNSFFEGKDEELF